jgi:tetratricopeptide (TPR) repeat protein
MLHINRLHRLGELAKAREWLDGLAKEMAQAASGTWPDHQIELEFRVGLGEAAEKHLLELVEKHGTNDLGRSFEAVFPQLGERANTLWRLMRFQSPNERVEDALKRLRKIEDRTINADELAALLRTAIPAEWMPKNASASAYDHLAWVVAWYDRVDLAEGLLAHPNWKDAPPSARVPLADTLAAAGKWLDAANAYRRIWETDPTAPLPCFLHGWALAKLGKEEDGKKMMETAYRMLLGGESMRFEFDGALMERGFIAAARRDLPLRARLGSSSYYLGRALDRAARLAQQQGDYATAATIHERNLLRFLPAGTGLTNSGGYMRMPALIHALRAKGLLAQGQKEEAFREIDRARQIHPTHLEIPILLVADLERAGEKERAAQLFDQIYSAIEKGSQDFPNCADAHNQLAWLAARCRRRLDEALTHSQKAVELAPLVPSYLDTLAEVYFQRGNTAKAIELMKKCLKMPSANVGFYRQQLVRFEKGDPKIEPADE